jgi:LuxR family maltose regulon positive regulatory protein
MVEAASGTAGGRERGMTSTLVTTKLYVPRPRRSLVARARLSAMLDAGSETALTLVAAPAGFGKTTALTSWLAAGDRSVAWVSLDESDAQATLFWQYVIGALDSAAPGTGLGAMAQLAAGQPASPSLLTTVLNDIAVVPQEIELVLDDYHLADSTEVAQGMTFLLEHRPPNLHVVISTRADPDLPLARLRARGELVEVRARDLRFTGDEAAVYLTEVGGLRVEASDVAALESRTEGWVAALQLAALSMQGRDDVGDFIAGFAGTDRYVVDYLADEVLSRQPEQVRDFLMRTSVLERLGPDLCDAVVEREGSRAMLESLERANLFVVPLDDQRRWYRYHHLFADVLRAHLSADHPDLVAGLHLRASRWYDEAGEPVPAVRHALAAGDPDRAADLVETATPALRRARQEATLRRWIGDFPDDVVRIRPVLAIAFVGALMSSNEFDDVGRRVRELDERLPAIRAHLAHDGSALGRQVVAVDDGELARVPSALELYRAGLALVSGDLPATHRHARLAIDMALPDDDVVRSGAAGLSGLAHWACGELDDAHRSYMICIDGLLRARHLSDALGCFLTAAEIRMAQGRLADAKETLDEGMRLAAAAGTAPPRGTADMHVGLAELALERGDVETAATHLDAAAALGEECGLPQLPYRSRVAAAALAEARGDLVTALELVLAAEQVYLGDFSPNVRPLLAVAARLQVRLGDLDATDRWVREHRLSSSDGLSYLREFEHVTLADVLLAQNRVTGELGPLDEADHLLQRLLDDAEAGGRGSAAVDVQVLQAMAAAAHGDDARALDVLARALVLAEPEGQVRAFGRHGDAVTPLLERLLTRSEASEHTRAVASACRRSVLPTDAPAAPGSVSGSEAGALVEPLSARELEVLRLLASELDGPDIARHLFVSLNTLRTHTKSIYTKLGVNSRRAAVSRGRELGLLTG